MILGPLEARFQRASNEPNPIDFLSLKPEKIAIEVVYKKCTILFFFKKYMSI